MSKIQAVGMGLNKMQNLRYKLDRHTFHMGSHEDTEYYHAQCQPTTYIDRLNAATYLSYIAFGVDIIDYSPR